VSKILGLDASDGIAEIVLGHEVVPVEHGSGAVTGHAHHHGFGNAEPAGPGDEAAAQVVEPDAVEPCRLPRTAEGLADVLPGFSGPRIAEEGSRR